jgi:hypothetical protein
VNALTHVTDPAELAQRVINLWDRCGGWIPGGAREELAEALGVAPSAVRTPQQIRRDAVLTDIAEHGGGETYCLRDDDGDWWIFQPSAQGRGHWRTMGGAPLSSNGLDSGARHIAMNFGIDDTP